MLVNKGIIAGKIGDLNSVKITEEKLDPSKIGPKDVLVKHSCFGVSFDDVSYARGDYFDSSFLSSLKMPSSLKLGLEAAGVVVACGKDVKHLKSGDRVCHATAPLGSFCEHRIVDSRFLIRSPNYLNDQIICAVLRRGLTAHYLLHRIYLANKKHTIMVYGAAGGVGQILCRWASSKGVRVIGIVGADEKKEVAKRAGCHFVLNYKTEKVFEAVNEITKGTGANAVFDSIGKDTLAISLACITNMGMFVSFGQASGNFTLHNIKDIHSKCIFFTRPSLFVYSYNRTNLILQAEEVFRSVLAKQIGVTINQTQFSSIPATMLAISQGGTTGSTIATF